jgi:proline racemase
VRYDIAYGGNFYAFVELADLRIPFERSAKGRLLDAGLAIMDAINEQNPVVHPEQPEIDVCHHVYLEAPDSTPRHGRHAMAIHPGWFDRSPCGTGTSARLAVLHARGLVGVGEEVVNESFIGSRFGARIRGEATVGDRPGILPSITGRAWITGTAQYLLDPNDPFPAGFEL